MDGLLILTAVAAERDAVLGAVPPGRGVAVGVVGVGPAEAGAGAARQIAAHSPRLVLCAGIGGGFAPAAPGQVVVASRIVHADLGAQTPDGFADAAALGFGTVHYGVREATASALAARTGARIGAILTVSTVTGTASGAAALRERHPDAVAEAMEGAGVAAAAVGAGVEVAEIRAISNVVGPRDRGAWRVDRALEALARAVAAITGAPWWT